MHVIATAGHVDHGKSTLLRALTGMEPDRWAEKKRRGLTIDLGFVWTTELDVAFVDVPGHERFITNMLAGVGPVPAVLFVVAADGGWQMQSEEHLAVINAFGIQHGLLVVTRADLADPAPALAEATEHLSRSSLGNLEAMAVSAVNGQGLPSLRAALERLTSAIPTPDPDTDLRIWIDRTFIVDGRGIVVTGTLSAGTIRTAQTLTVAGTGESVQVRGLHSMKVARDEVSGCARVAINLRGRAAGGLRRGDALISPGRWLLAHQVDVRLSANAILPSTNPMRLSKRMTWHIGSASVPARVRPLGADTARLTLDRPLPLRLGDRALLRDPGSHDLYGVTILDVRPPQLRRRGAVSARAAELARMDGVPDGTTELRRRGLIRHTDLLAMGVNPTTLPLPVVDNWLVDPGHWSRLREELVRRVTEHATRHPENPGLPAETLRQALGLPDRSLVDALADAASLRRQRGRITVARPTLPESLSTAIETVRIDLASAPFTAPDSARLAELGLNGRALAVAEAAGELLRVAPGVVLVPDAPEQATRILAGLPSPFTAAAARRALGTSRRVVIPLLEHLDRQGRTRRIDESHRVVIS